MMSISIIPKGQYKPCEIGMSVKYQDGHGKFTMEGVIDGFSCGRNTQKLDDEDFAEDFDGTPTDAEINRKYGSMSALFLVKKYHIVPTGGGETLLLDRNQFITDDSEIGGLHVGHALMCAFPLFSTDANRKADYTKDDRQVYDERTFEEQMKGALALLQKLEENVSEGYLSGDSHGWEEYGNWEEAGNGTMPDEADLKAWDVLALIWKAWCERNYTSISHDLGFTFRFLILMKQRSDLIWNADQGRACDGYFVSFKTEDEYAPEYVEQGIHGSLQDRDLTFGTDRTRLYADVRDVMEKSVGKIAENLFHDCVGSKSIPTANSILGGFPENKCARDSPEWSRFQYAQLEVLGGYRIAFKCIFSHYRNITTDTDTMHQPTSLWRPARFDKTLGFGGA